MTLTQQALSLTDISRVLARADRSVARCLAELVGDQVSVDEWRALESLGDGRAHTMAEVIAAVMLPAPTVTRLVDRLVSNGLAHRRVDDRDRRRVLVVLAPRGVALVERVRADVKVRTAELMDAEEIDLLSRAVELLSQLDS